MISFNLIKNLLIISYIVIAYLIIDKIEPAYSFYIREHTFYLHQSGTQISDSLFYPEKVSEWKKVSQEEFKNIKNINRSDIVSYFEQKKKSTINLTGLITVIVVLLLWFIPFRRKRSKQQ